MTLQTIFSQKGIPPRYGLDEIPADIAKRELLAHFSFAESTQRFIVQNCRRYPSRIVLGIQIGSYRMVGRFQYQPEAVPPGVIRHVARALKLKGEFIPLLYTDRIKTRWHHMQLAENHLGLVPFPPDRHPGLINRLALEPADPGHLPDWIKKAEEILRVERYVFPTAKMLRRLIATAREQSLGRVVEKIDGALSDEAKRALEELLQSPADEALGGMTKWAELTDKNAYRSTPEKLNALLERIQTIRALPSLSEALTGISDPHLEYLSQRGMHLSARQLGYHSPDQRRAIMCATLRELDAELTDIVIQMNDEILSGVFLRGRTRAENHYRVCRKTVRSVVRAFKVMSDVLLDGDLEPDSKLARIAQSLPVDQLKELREDADQLDLPKVIAELQFASRGTVSIQKYLPQFLETIRIVSPSGKDPILTALDYYRRRKQQGQGGIGDEAPTDFVQEKKWKKAMPTTANTPPPKFRRT
jgi:hypothetical protein